MHPAWRITEVRLQVLAYLEPGDLARLAQTCKDTFEFVIDRLWERLTSITPFLSFLPADVSLQTLNSDSIRRLDYYGRKVKQLVLDQGNSPVPMLIPKSHRGRNRNTGNRKDQLWVDLWAKVDRIRPSASFLPNLQHLRVNNVYPEVLRPLVGIAGTNLAHVYIKIVHEHYPGDAIQLFLGSLQETSKLEYLFVRDGLPDVLPLKLIANSPLKTLRLDPQLRNGHIYKKFALPREILLMPTLESLNIGLTRDWYSKSLGLPGKRFLTSLQRLWLNLRTFEPEKCSEDCVNIAQKWTCKHGPLWISARHRDTGEPHDCGRRSPILFIRGLDSPKLKLLNIKFRDSVERSMVLDTMQAVAEACQLQDLSELVLSNGSNCHSLSCGCNPYLFEKRIDQETTSNILNSLMPLPQLKVLHLPISCNFFGALDLQKYKAITSGLPQLQKLSVGHHHYGFASQGSTQIHERMPLKHIAAFCHLLPNLVEVNVGCVDATRLESSPNHEWVSSGVGKLYVQKWICQDDFGRTLIPINLEWLKVELQTYFPNSDLAARAADNTNGNILRTRY